MKKKIATILTAAVIGATAFTTIVSAASGDITVVSREDGSGTRGAFVELFGIEEEKDGEKVDMTTDEASVTNSTSVMMTTVAGDENAIGYISLGSLDDTVKAVKIDGVEATVDNVSNDSYKIARPFNIIVFVYDNCDTISCDNCSCKTKVFLFILRSRDAIPISAVPSAAMFTPVVESLC